MADSYGKFFKLPRCLLLRKDLGLPAKVVLAVIIDRIGDNGVAWSGMRWLEDNTLLSHGAVVAAIKTLVRAGDLVIVRQGKGRSTHYQLGKVWIDASGREMTTTESLLWSGNDHKPEISGREMTTTESLLWSGNDHKPEISGREMTTTAKSPQTPRKRNRDEIWDVLAELFQLPAETAQQCKRLGGLARELRALKPRPTAEEIRRRYQNLKTRNWQDVSPEGFIKWWSQMDRPLVAGRPPIITKPLAQLRLESETRKVF